jgi:transcription initiation factor TFIIIB Brf1 subunit/transcription initiation factor TFIIB
MSYKLKIMSQLNNSDKINNSDKSREEELINQLFKKVNLIIYNQERTKEDVENAKNIIEQISEKNDDKTIKIILSNYRRYVNKRALLNIINNFNDIDDITYIISIIVNMYDLEKKDIILIINALVNKIFSKDFLSELWRIFSYLSLPSEVIENIYINIKNKYLSLNFIFKMFKCNVSNIFCHYIKIK